MAIEIERKFLVAGDGWRRQVTASKRMLQGYIAENDACVVRVRLEGDEARLNIKSSGLDIVRQEYEYPVPVADAQRILDTLCGGRTVCKTRHYVPASPGTWEVDVFEDANAGLVVAEIELDSRDQAFERPDWLGAEVSGDPRYLNSNLAGRPYRDWR